MPACIAKKHHRGCYLSQALTLDSSNFWSAAFPSLQQSLVCNMAIPSTHPVYGNALGLSHLRSMSFVATISSHTYPTLMYTNRTFSCQGSGCRWWQEADSPWQLLAVCYDLQAALASGNPEAYRSKIPVHQDGSCNGLQHYAALGRDEPGGRAVNLLPVDRPQVRPHLLTPLLLLTLCMFWLRRIALHQVFCG